MRILLILGGVFLVLLLALGVAGWWVTEPMRFAGVERDSSTSAAHRTAVELDRPDITRREIVELLRARDFETLTRVIETRNDRALADPKEEWELGRIVDAFHIADDELGDVFDDWIQATPVSYAPLLASAEHRFALAYLSRGTATASETTREQFAGMTEQLGLLIEDLNAALKKEPRLSEAYRLLIDAYRTGGTQIDCGNAARRGLEVMPASFRIRSALAACRLPRWGGSYQRVKDIAAMANPFVVDNPRLAALHGFVEWDLARIADGDEALGHFAAALQSGDHVSFYADRADEHRRADRYREALDDTDAALKLSPDSPALLVDRLYALLGLGRHEDLPAIIELVEAIDPLNPQLPEFKQYASKVAVAEGYDLQQGAMNGASVERISQAIALNGGDATAHYWRGRAYLKAGDVANALADFEEAVRLDPAHFESYRNIDYIYAQRGDWARVISMWNDYLRRNPDDGRAIFERGGAYRHSGNEEQAMADARSACELGVKEACAVVRR